MASTRRRSPSPVRRRRSPSPSARPSSSSSSSAAHRRRSPSPARRRSPSPARRRSPSPARRRSPSPHRRRSPSSPARPSSSSSHRRRSPSPQRRRSPSPPQRRRSPSPPKRRRSPSPAASQRRKRSPSPRAPSRSPSRSRSRSRSRSPSPAPTPTLSKEEEKRLRKLEKKRLKEEKKLKEAHMNELMGYSNVDNPYGDTNLTDKFKWHKKREMEERKGISEEEARVRDLERRRETVSELEKLKKRRMEREVEKAQHEADLQQQQREREYAQYGDMETKENEFHLEQVKVRAQIRIREGRAKAIDILALSMNLDYSDVEISLEEPYRIFEELPITEMEDLKNDIQMYLELGKDSQLIEFWQAMLVICHDAIERTRGDAKSGLHPSVTYDIQNILANKSVKQLEVLQASIVQKLASGQPIDVEYWDALLKALFVYKARATVHEMHAAVLRKRLDMLREQQREEAERAQEELEAMMAAGYASGGPDEDGAGRRGPDPPAASVCREAMGGNGGLAGSVAAAGEESDGAAGSGASHAAAGGAAASAPSLREGEINLDMDEDDEQAKLSPVLLSALEDMRIVALDPDDDWRRLLAKREEVMANQLAATQQHAQAMGLPAAAAVNAAAQAVASAVGSMVPDGSVAAPPAPVAAQGPMSAMAAAFAGNLGATSEADKLVAIEAAKPAQPDEAPFNSGDIPVERQVYLWQDKYRPRKPRYFNRIHTGFEWNKYNQTHYDHDNPPPKTVQGYKFNIFYPDLIDKNQAPTFKIMPDPASPDAATCIIRFHAGPPYEDLAFRIVNREWEQSHKRGFRCTFDRGILYLHFRFKRYRYRK